MFKVLLFSKIAYCPQETFNLDFHNIFFCFSWKRDTETSLSYITYSFSSLLFCRKMFRNLVCVIIAFDNSLLKKEIWWLPVCFFLRGACLFKASRLMLQNLWKESSLKRATLKKPCVKNSAMESVYNKIAVIGSRPVTLLKWNLH